MAGVAAFVAEGFEEIELVTPVDLWRRSGLDVTLVSLSGNLVRGSHGIELCCQQSFDHYVAQQQKDEVLFLPGGLPGSRHLAESEGLRTLLKRQLAEQRWVAAICAAPALVLGAAGLLEGQDYTCYPGFDSDAYQGRHLDQPVVRSGWLITGQGAGVAAELAGEVVRVLQGDAAAAQVLEATLFTGKVLG